MAGVAGTVELLFNLEAAVNAIIYQAKITLKQNKMNIDGKWLKLAPGMPVTEEVNTGKRRIVEHFLSPLLAHVSENVRER